MLLYYHSYTFVAHSQESFYHRVIVVLKAKIIGRHTKTGRALTTGNNGRLVLRKIEATAGTSDRGDVFVRIVKMTGGYGINIAVESRVKSLYEAEILKTVKKKLKEMQASDMRVEIKDQAAFDYVINARIETAVYRVLQAGRQ